MNNIIGEIKKSAAESLRVQLVERNGKLKIDMRQYFRPDEDQDWLPTKKGITIDVGAWPDFKKVLERLDKEIARLGIR